MVWLLVALEDCYDAIPLCLCAKWVYRLFDSRSLTEPKSHRPFSPCDIAIE